MSEKELIAHRDFARALARRLVQDAASADDVTQDVMARLLQCRRPETIRGWLRRVVRNVASGHRDRERRRAEVERRGANAGRARPSAAAELAQRLELQRRLTSRVLALDEDSREVILVHFYAGKSVAETADELAIPLETARSRLRRALAKLRANWNVELGGEREGLVALALLARCPVSKGLIAATVGTPLFWGGVFAMTTQAKGIAAAVTVAVAAAGAFFSLSGGGDSRGSSSRDIETAPRPPAPAVADVPAPAPADATDTPVRKTEPTPAGTAVPDEMPGSVLVRAVWKRDGGPAADVEVACDQGRGRALGRTNSDGIVVLDGLRPGRASVGGDRGGRVTTSIESGRQVEVTLELSPGITILGRVEDSRGEPVSGADVWLSEGSNFVLGHVVAQSGADGSFSIRDVSAFVHDRSGKIGAGTSESTSSRLLGARARGFIPSDLVTLDVSADWKPLRLVLPGRGASLGGRVLDPEGRPVPRATVILHQESRARVNTRDSLSNGGMGSVTLGSIYATTDKLGRFHFSGWCSGQSWLFVRTATWANSCERIDLPEGAEADREIRLDAGVTVKGVVSQPDDESAAYVVVQCRSDGFEPIASTYTSDDGSYTLNCVPAGDFEIQAERRERRVSERLQGRAGETITWSPVLKGGAQIQGLLLDDSQVPLEGWWIDATEESQARPVPGTGTDHNGSFVLKSLDPRGVYRLTVRGGPIPSTVLEHVRPGAPVSIVVSSDRRPSCAMKGVVVDSAGNGIGGACVLVSTRSGGTQVTTESESGRFRLERLTPEPYALVIRAEGFSELRLEDHELHPNESWDAGSLRLSRK